MFLHTFGAGLHTISARDNSFNRPASEGDINLFVNAKQPGSGNTAAVIVGQWKKEDRLLSILWSSSLPSLRHPEMILYVVSRNKLRRIRACLRTSSCSGDTTHSESAPGDRTSS